MPRNGGTGVCFSYLKCLLYARLCLFAFTQAKNRNFRCAQLYFSLY
jgi:hypothetical protein